ncbi:MAG: HAD family hydrolase [Jatrophihabitans sp.]|uniref:HAD family hydrolase n=1 Tax=Jatrophihabitans sp. TaxID=1932789 RepID=UPI00391239C6
MSVAAVIFDWGGTLTPWHSIDAGGPWRAVVTDDELAHRLALAEDEIWRRARDHHRSGTLDDVFAAVGLEPTPDMRAAISAWWDPHTYTDPDVLPLFEALRARELRIGVLSNTIWSREEHERIFARDGLLDLIDGAVYTSEIEWTKPHPMAFRAALDAVGVDRPEEAVFVGDRPFDDIHGAQSAGLRAVLIPHSDIPEAQKGPVAGKPDAVVDRLADLLAIVDEWRAA